MGNAKNWCGRNTVSVIAEERMGVTFGMEVSQPNAPVNHPQSQKDHRPMIACQETCFPILRGLFTLVNACKLHHFWYKHV